MNSNQFLTLLKKGNDLQKEDFQQLVKLHASFPYFQIPAVLAAKYENKNQKGGTLEMLHKAAILSPDRAWLRSLIENDILFLEDDKLNTESDEIPESSSVIIIDHQKDLESPEDLTSKEEIYSSAVKEEVTDEYDEKEQTSIVTNEISDKVAKEEQEKNHHNPELSDLSEAPETNKSDISSKDPIGHNEPFRVKDEQDALSSEPIEDGLNKDHPEMVSNSHPTEEDTARPELITSQFGGNEETRPDLITSDSASETTEKVEDQPKLVKPEDREEDKSIIDPIPGPPSSRQQILKQLEDNLARLKSESSKNKPSVETDEEPKTTKPRRRRSGEDLIDSIKKKEKREIKDTKKKEQNDIIKAFNKKSIKLAAIKENEDVNKLQDLSLPSTKINDRMVSESYAKLLTQQGKKAAAKEIYKKLILKFPQKKAYFADLIQQLEE